ncbi:hypothetical protein J0X19_04995 [Hymenobacter sp. BT186]|uniref:Uncharacterized protein n=1 Tax=Hymenobacter telluris TaxID=2816474 RepID=A0A939EVJ9_9BACT|nr:hypothetical protein [Hymenobacter telluris]MBO0357292.1 hypothetical protein [Hymenobacter telluris]MBW3373318.1 hypothetical protein [Hymenobacter norwichensis]
MTAYNLRILVFIALSGLLVCAFVLSIRGIIKTKAYRRVFWILGFVALIPFALLDAFVGFLFLLSYYPHYSFDRADWANDVQQRYTMADDLVDSKWLIGLTRSQAIDLLGKPYRGWDNTIRFDIGDRPTMGLDLDPDELVLELKDEKVVNCYLNET